jgi:hypothetical protein
VFDPNSAIPTRGAKVKKCFFLILLLDMTHLSGGVGEVGPLQVERMKLPLEQEKTVSLPMPRIRENWFRKAVCIHIVEMVLQFQNNFHVCSGAYNTVQQPTCSHFTHKPS